ncbi:uncharacterized protein [Rutidosis leptorrhynchoides]|uniref:uncharacterized protein n=1 Tax=Rutidosis leptorrhynchoides TaxID=125765 RepID=UPI003A9A3AFD
MHFHGDLSCFPLSPSSTTTQPLPPFTTTQPQPPDEEDEDLHQLWTKPLVNSTSHDVWTALARTYHHDSPERVHTLRDTLRHLKKGSSTVSEYPLADDDKTHWYLCGLGSSFKTFSTTQRLLTPRPLFRALVSQAESHGLFLQSVSDSVVAHVAFNTASSNNSTNITSRGRGKSYMRGSSSRGMGRGNRRPTHCQLCRTDGHYAKKCPDIQTFARGLATLDANQYNTTPNWYVDTGASAHMTSNAN